MAFLAFLLILGVLIFVHELGHFMVARWSGVVVEEFGFGFPPRIWGVKRGSTMYSINWIPFGGFVKMQGELEDEQHRPNSFVQAPFKKQAAILVAGVAMNAILAWILVTATLAIGTTIDATTKPNNHFVRTSAARVEAVVSDNTAASAAGLRNGDRVTAVQGQPVQSTEEVINLVTAAQYPTITVNIVRDTTPLTLTIIPRPASDHPHYGFGVQSLLTVRYPWYIAPWYGATTSLDLARQTALSFWNLLKDLVVRAHVSPDLAGPVGIAVLTGQVVQFGFIATLQFMAMLSMSLAVVNIVPFPALDGGRLLLGAIGRLRGRAISLKTEGVIHTVGFYVLIVAVILLSIRDVSRFQLLDQLRSFFSNL
jgi:regulator of sigma E protease